MAPTLPSDHPPATAWSPAEVELWVIEAARRRQRRRRLKVAAATLAAATLATIIVSNGGGGARRSDSITWPLAAGVTVESPAAIFWQDPYMGVACHVPNWIGCDRVGLAVWLRWPARAVTATIVGARLKLDDRRWSYIAHYGRHTVHVYAGFLQPAGLITRLHVIPEARTETWLGNDAPSPLVRFRIDYGAGRIVVTQEHVWLSAGWG
jgi:hypothetical protein